MPSLIARINLWKGALESMNFTDFWYLFISLMATVPGLNLRVFLIPPSAAAVFFLAFEALLIFEPVATLCFDAEPLTCFLPAIFYLGILE